MGEIEKFDVAFVLGAPLYREKYENRDEEVGKIVAVEMDLINRRLTGREKQKEPVIGLLLAGDKENAFPPLLKGRRYTDSRNERDYFAVMFDVMLGLYGHGKVLPGIPEWRERLRL